MKVGSGKKNELKNVRIIVQFRSSWVNTGLVCLHGAAFGRPGSSPRSRQSSTESTADLEIYEFQEAQKSCRAQKTPRSFPARNGAPNDKIASAANSTADLNMLGTGQGNEGCISILVIGWRLEVSDFGEPC